MPFDGVLIISQFLSLQISENPLTWNSYNSLLEMFQWILSFNVSMQEVLVRLANNENNTNDNYSM